MTSPAHYPKRQPRRYTRGRLLASDYQCQALLPTWAHVAIAVLVALLVVLGVSPAARMLGVLPLSPAPTVEREVLHDMAASGDGGYVFEDDDAYLEEVLASPAKVQTLTLSFETDGSSGGSVWRWLGLDPGDGLSVEVSTKGVGESGYSHETDGILLSNVPSTQTIVLPERDDDIESVRVVFKDVESEGATALRQGVAFNQAVPISVPPLLLAMVLLLVLLVSSSRPASFLACAKTRNHPKLAQGMIVAIAAAFCALAVACVTVGGTSERAFVNKDSYARNDPHQYQYQAEALLEGHAYLDLPVPEWLAELDYPYDPEVRAELAKESGEPYYWDYAFYQGKYYCYFGLLPVVTLFAPFRLVTGADLSNHAATAVLAVLAAIAVAALTVELVRRVDEDATMSTLLVSLVASYVLSGILYLAFYPSFYHIALLSSLVCALGGVACWLRADRGQPEVRRGLLLLGSILVGCCLLGRPSLFLVVLMAFPIFGHRFWRLPRRERQFFSTRPGAILNTTLVVVPIAALALVCMWWNRMRFGSALDFGYKYNLTAFDMVAQEFDPNKTLFGLAMYLIAPIIPKAGFPFMTNYQTDQGLFSAWAGTVAYLGLEPYYGGLVAFCPFVLVLLACLRRDVRESLRREGLSRLVALSLLTGLIIATFDSTVSVTQRYQSEFFWLAGMATIAVYVTRRRELRGMARGRRRLGLLSLLMSLLVAVAVALQLMNLFTVDRYASLYEGNPEVWWTVWSWFRRAL